MKQSEKIVLETLRKTTLAYLSENEYSALEKAVEANGILNLTGATAHILKSAVVKHGDSHNQGSHGNWANGGMGGGSASSGGSGMDRMLERGKKALEGRDYKAMMRDYDKMEESWRKKLDKPYDPENEEYGDPQDLAQADFYRKYGATPMDVQFYAEALPSVGKATGVKRGDMVSWNSSGGTARGKVVRVINSGKLDVPKTNFEINADEDDPAVLIQLYRDGKPTETQVGHKMSTLRKS